MRSPLTTLNRVNKSFSIFLTTFETLEIVFRKIVTILMMTAKKTALQPFTQYLRITLVFK